MMLPDRMTEELREVAKEFVGAQTDDESCEALRAFLAICAHYGYGVDEHSNLQGPK